MSEITVKNKIPVKYKYYTRLLFAQKYGRDGEAYSESSQTFNMERLAKIIDGRQLLTIFSKSSTIHVGLGFTYGSGKEYISKKSL